MAIEQNLADILAARYGRDVRQSIHDGIAECYSDVSEAKTRADESILNVDAKVALADAAALNANQKADLANTAAQTANTAATNADQKADLANTAASSANTAAQTANAAADNAEAKAILANNAAQYASGFTQPYIHIKYSAVQPTSNADMVDVPSDWIGLYSGNSATAPVNYTDYRWFRYKGETGDVGNHNHDTLYLGIAAKAADSDKLDGKDSTEFSDKVHTHTKSEITDFPETMPPSPHMHGKDDITDFPTEMPPEAHAHGNITNDGKIGTSADNFLVTGADGIVEAKDIPSVVGLIGVSNQNILHNWDFRNPINQRGVSGAISTGTYFFDRWMRNSGTVTVAAGYLMLASGSEIEQRIEGNLLAGAVCTVSFEVGGTIYHGSGAFPATNGTVSVVVDGYPNITFGCATGYMFILIPATSDTSVKRLKCEMGFVSTLHLDPPMDHAVELLKCQRYYRELPKSTKFYGVLYNGLAYVSHYLSPPMRIGSTLVNVTTFSVYYSGTWAELSPNSTGPAPSRIEVVIPISSGGGPVIAGSNSVIVLTADL